MLRGSSPASYGQKSLGEGNGGSRLRVWAGSWPHSALAWALPCWVLVRAASRDAPLRTVYEVEPVEIPVCADQRWSNPVSETFQGPCPTERSPHQGPAGRWDPSPVHPPSSILTRRPRSAGAGAAPLLLSPQTERSLCSNTSAALQPPPQVDARPPHRGWLRTVGSVFIYPTSRAIPRVLVSSSGAALSCADDLPRHVKVQDPCPCPHKPYLGVTGQSGPRVGLPGMNVPCEAPGPAAGEPPGKPLAPLPGLG